MKTNNPFDWKSIEDKSTSLDPCEESYFYAEKWRREGRKSVLDLGCGIGRHALLFAKYGFKVTAVDISDDALSFLKKQCKEQGLDIACRKADMVTLPFSVDAFDCIFAVHSPGHTDTEGMDRLIAELRRVLRPEGALFMTLCSKDTFTYKSSDLPRIDENTLLKTEDPEQGAPHYFADRDNICSLFSDFELIKVRHIDDCFFGGKWKDQKHWFIEARLHKSPTVPDYSDILGSTVHCTIDRALGQSHPRIRELIYPVNYGYVNGVFAGDGAEQDVYVLGVNEPLKEFTGKIIAVYHRFNDNEDKWIAAPEGMTFTDDEIMQKIDFQERFFDGELYMK